MTGPALLEASQVTKRYGSVVALEDVSFGVHRQEVACLLGDNGAGTVQEDGFSPVALTGITNRNVDAGGAGVTHVLELIDAEIRVAMALTGCTRIDQIGIDVIDQATS